MEVTWVNIVMVIFGAISLLGGGALAFLGLFIDKKLNAAKNEILNHIDARFALKELVETKLTVQNKLLEDLKTRMDRFEFRHKDGN